MLSRIKNKKGVSIMIGYVLLITFVVVMGVVIYNWMKTYVPREDLECPDGVSIFIKDYTCNSNELNFTLLNNGKFNVGGYFIHVSNVSDEEIATIDITTGIKSGEDALSPTGIKLNGSENSFGPSDEVVELFSISGIGPINSVEIIPIRWQEENRRTRLVSCQNSRIREILTCSETAATSGESCDYGYLDCNELISGCETNNLTDNSNCGTCGNECLIGTCSDGVCDSCDGAWVGSSETSNVECDGGDNCLASCVCETGYEPDEIGGCQVPSSVEECSDYCIWLGTYSGGFCRSNAAQCTVNDQIYEEGGDSYCEESESQTGDHCCCV